MVLTLLAILIAALVALAIAAAFVPRTVSSIGSAGISGLVVLLALASMAGVGDAAVLVLPLGPAGVAMHLALDPLGACFLLLVFIAGVPCALFADDAPVSRAGLPASLAAMVLAFLAGDPFTLAVGLLLLGFAFRLMRGRDDAASAYLHVAIFGIVCVIVALALAAPRSVAWLDGDFAAIRAAPPEGWRAGAVFILVALGVGSQAALAWRPGLASPVATTVWMYVLIRLLFDLCATTQQSWWGVPLLLAGAIAALAGTLRASFDITLRPVLLIGSLHQLGLSVVALGAALLARAVDLPGVALFALEAAWLLLACHVLCRTLLLLCAGAVEQGAGTTRLDRMGGLIHRMKVTAACTLAGLFGVAVLPPGLAFAGAWMLFQSLLAVARTGGLGLQLVVAVVALATALSGGLATFAAVRLFAVVFLGRPRTPRTAVADEASASLRAAVIALAALSGLLALLPGLALMSAGPALTELANGASGALAFALTLRPSAEAPGYDPIMLAALLLLVGCAIVWLLQRTAMHQYREESAWSGGVAPPPAWLPFGDPATQYGPASFAEPLQRMAMSLSARPRVVAASIRAALVRERDRLVRLAMSLGQADASRSLAAGLVVLVLAMAAWLVAP